MAGHRDTSRIADRCREGVRRDVEGRFAGLDSRHDGARAGRVRRVVLSGILVSLAADDVVAVASDSYRRAVVRTVSRGRGDGPRAGTISAKLFSRDRARLGALSNGERNSV